MVFFLGHLLLSHSPIHHSRLSFPYTIDNFKPPYIYPIKYDKKLNKL